MAVTENQFFMRTLFVLKFIFCSWLLLVVGTALSAQVVADVDPKPFIEVTGIAEKELVPDEIYIQILLRERQTNKEKATITQQEEKLRAALKAIGIDLANLYLSGANADFVVVRRKPNEVLTQKDYTLKVATAMQVGLVFQQLDRLEILDASIARVHHSRLDSLKKEIKIAAIKAAKDKADYLLAAIGEQTGKPLIVQEYDSGVMPIVSAVAQSSRMEEMPNSTDLLPLTKEDELQFNKIKLEARIYVKFAIK